jgi:uncharacterized protein (DUF2147 family)
VSISINPYRSAVLCFGAAFLAASSTSVTATQPVPVGEWLVDSGLARVKIGVCKRDGQKLCGYIIWLKFPNDDQGKPRLDVYNPETALRKNRIIGVEMLRDLVPSGDGWWVGGTIYDPKTGKQYESKMKIAADGTLKVDGCVFVICRTQTWTRVG